MAMSRVSPSGAAFTTDCAPSTVLAPGRFSITTGWPQSSVIRWPISRASTSDGPPAGNGTTMRIDRAGKFSVSWRSWAPATATADSHATAIQRCTELMILISGLVAWTGSIRTTRSFHRGAQHQPALGGGKIGARVRRAAVVPQQQVALAPHVLVDELAPLAMVPQQVEQRIALLVRQAKDFHGHQAVHVGRLAPGILMGAEHRMPAFAERRRALVVAALG